MEDQKKLLKEDINFLEYPNWILKNQKKKITSWVIEKEHGKYEILCPLGLPKHFDKTILYFLIYKLYKETSFNKYILATNRHEIAKNVYSLEKDFGKNRYLRIMGALKKWKSISINFEGVFFGDEGYLIKYFSVVDEVTLKKETGELKIRFNEGYINQLKESKFYKLIDFEQYKKLHKSSSARLYEILVKTFETRNDWFINIQLLAEKLTFEKKQNAKNYYASDVLRYLKPAINEINQKTDLYLDFKYNKESGICIFKKLKKQKNTFIPAVAEKKSNKKNDYWIKFNSLSEEDKNKILNGIQRDHFIKCIPDEQARIIAYMEKNMSQTLEIN